MKPFDSTNPVTIEWSKCGMCGAKIDGGKEEYQKHIDKGECVRYLLYELTNIMHRIEEHIYNLTREET
jgi:hypothetical protein